MIRDLCAARAPRDDAARDGDIPAAPAGAAPLTGDAPMTWTTPTATDLRLGFEITMYVAAR